MLNLRKKNYISKYWKFFEFMILFKWIIKRSKKDFSINVSKEDTILTLSTCAN